MNELDPNTFRISLAQLARLSAHAPPEPGPPAQGQGRFLVGQEGHPGQPSIADLSECLFFSPDDGRIWMHDRRMVLLHAEALGGLRRELIDSLGLDKARGLLTRAGYLSGARDAELVRRQWPDADPAAAALAGTRLHALEGMVKVEVVHVRYDPGTGDYEGEFIWHNASEADEHIAAYGVTGTPVCWMQTGYATGYVSTLFGRLILFREVACRSAGDAHCVVVGRSVDRWEDPREDLRHLDLAADGAPVPRGDGDDAAWVPACGADGPRAADPALVGASSAFKAAVHMVRRVAPTQATVLFTGESGVGKEVFARYLHRVSDRARKPFLAINCAAIPESLMESELFGVERGAYTGASASRPGRFERADGGTLFLDEIGTLSLVAQGKLLRALQEGEIERVGGTRTLRLDVRLVAATHVDLRQAVRDGAFREDLFYRLNVFPVHLPPLRERRDDIPMLTQHFLDHYRLRYGRAVRGITQRAVKALFNYRFSGNIRELQNLIERAMIMANDGELIDLHHLFLGGESLSEGILSIRTDSMAGPQGRLQGAAPTPEAAEPLPGATLEEAEARWMAAALQRHAGNVAAAARQLGITRATLMYRARRYGIPVGRAHRP